MVARADSEQAGLAALAQALASAALRPGLPEALGDLAEAARAMAGADVALVRVPAADGRLEAIAVAGASALAAELEGTSLPAADLPRTPLSDLATAPAAVRRTAAGGGALAEAAPVTAVSVDGLPGGCTVLTVLRLGEPAVGLLQLLFVSDSPDAEQLGRLRTFGVRAAHALRASARARSLAVELERTRALLAVVGQATAELSLAHTLETAVERVSELLAVDS